MVPAVAADAVDEVPAAPPLEEGGVVCCPLEERFLPFRPTGFFFSFL